VKGPPLGWIKAGLDSCVDPDYSHYIEGDVKTTQDPLRLVPWRTRNTVRGKLGAAISRSSSQVHNR